MKYTRLVSLIVLICAFAFNGLSSLKDEFQRMNPADLKMHGDGFIKNEGQVGDRTGKVNTDVLYSLNSDKLSIYIRKDGISYFFRNIIEGKERKPGEKFTEHTIKDVEGWRVDMNLLGTNSITDVQSVGKKGPKFDYYFAHCPEGVKGVSATDKIIIKEIYDGIDWVIYHTPEGGMKYDFIVSASGDPKKIRWKYDGAEKVERSNHELLLKTPMGCIVEGDLLTYQQQGSTKRVIDSRYIRKGDTYGFNVADYDKASNLIIDPPLIWSTYFEGPSGTNNSFTDLATDSKGNVYTLMTSTQADYPQPAPAGYYSGGPMGFGAFYIAEFDNTTAHTWGAFYGGGFTGVLTAKAIAIDPNDNIYLTGITDAFDFPTFDPGGSNYQVDTLTGFPDGCIVKFDVNRALAWATYFPSELGRLAIDKLGNKFMTGVSWPDLPITTPPGAYTQATFWGGPLICKFDIQDSLVWATSYAGTWWDTSYDLSIDSAGNVIMTGNANSADLPMLDPGNGAYFDGVHSAGNGNDNIFISKWDNNGKHIWATFFDWGTGWAVSSDPFGNTYVAGNAGGSLPTVDPGNGAYMNTVGAEMFIAQFNANDSLIWSTYYGQAFNETPYDIEADDFGNLYVCGVGTYTSFTPTTSSACDFVKSATSGGSPDRPAISLFGPAHDLQWNTILGELGLSNSAWAGGLDLDPDNNLYVVGSWAGTALTTKPAGGFFDGFPDNANNANPFIAKFGAGLGANVVISDTGQATCNFTGGSATVGVLAGNGPYGYAWTPNVSVDSFATGLDTGNYQVTVTDFYGCQTTLSIDVNPGLPVAGAITDTSNASCAGDSSGTATATPFGGSPPYTYTWSDGQTDSVATGLAPGSYTVVIADGSGCDTTLSIDIAATYSLSAAFSDTTLPACAGDSSGSATAIPLTGIGPFNYTWSDGQTDSIATGLTVGSYLVTVSDSNGCDTSLAITLAPSYAMTAAFTDTTMPACAGDSSGIAITTPQNGVGPYNYLWADGQTDSTAVSLPAGNYMVIVTDANGCDTAMSIMLVDSYALTAAFTDVTMPACTGDSSGYVVTTPQNGVGPYTYQWADGQTDSTAIGLPAGNYMVTITDSNGCDTAMSINLADSYFLSVAITDSTMASCAGIGDGVAIVTPSNGTSPFTYNWSSGSTDSTATALVAGVYSVVVTDTFGCDTTIAITISDLYTLEAVISDTTMPACNGESNGSALASPTNGVGPYSYNWSSGSTSPIAGGLAASTYTVTITDGAGCDTTLSIDIIDPPLLAASVTDTTHVLCFGDNTGDATVTTTGGTGAYTYNWSPSGGNASTGMNLGVGAYLVIVTDANGCDTSMLVSITQPTDIVVNTTGVDVTCGGNNGEASAMPSGGVPGYTYSWDINGSTDQTITGLGAGTYTVTVTDTNGCNKNSTVQINLGSQVPSIVAGGGALICEGDTVMLTASGGTTYQWFDAGGVIGTDSTLLVYPMITTVYLVEGAGTNGCKNTDTVMVSTQECLGDTVLFIPNIFSPNGDGINDKFRIQGERIDFFELKVFNRWGELVFESNDLNNSWDGSFQNPPKSTRIGEEIVPIDVYTYICNTTYTKISGAFSYTGNVTVVK